MALRFAARSEVSVTEIDVLLITSVPVADVAGEINVGCVIDVPGILFPATEVTYWPILTPVNCEVRPEAPWLVEITGAEAVLLTEISATFPVAAAVNKTELLVAEAEAQPVKFPENE